MLRMETVWIGHHFRARSATGPDSRISGRDTKWGTAPHYTPAVSKSSLTINARSTQILNPQILRRRRGPRHVTARRAVSGVETRAPYLHMAGLTLRLAAPASCCAGAAPLWCHPRGATRGHRELIGSAACPIGSAACRYRRSRGRPRREAPRACAPRPTVR